MTNINGKDRLHNRISRYYKNVCRDWPALAAKLLIKEIIILKYVIISFT